MAMMTRVEVVIVKIAGWRVILEWGGHLAKSCTCRKSNPDIGLGEGYSGFARRHPYGAVFRTSGFVLGDEAPDARVRCRCGLKRVST
jgi:hypothetical protein